MMRDLFPNLGNPKMNSIEMFVHAIGGIVKGCSALGFFTISPLYH
jgi:hypothetical protein